MTGVVWDTTTDPFWHVPYRSAAWPTAMQDTSYRLVKSEVCDLTPELAQQFRDLDPSPTERELNPARIKHLKTKAEAGQLVTFHWSVAKIGRQAPSHERATQLEHAVHPQRALPEGSQGSPRRIRGAEQAITRPAVSAVRRPQVESISERRGECISGPLRGAARRSQGTRKDGRRRGVLVRPACRRSACTSCG